MVVSAEAVPLLANSSRNAGVVRIARAVMDTVSRMTVVGRPGTPITNSIPTTAPRIDATKTLVVEVVVGAATSGIIAGVATTQSGGAAVGGARPSVT